MRRDAVAFALSGTLFGLLVGWIIGSQQAPAPATPQPAAAVQSSAAAPPAFDSEQAASLQRQAESRPEDAAIREELGDLYFGAERYDEAVAWYEAVLTIDPKNTDVSNNLALSYFATSQVDRALAQLDRSLAIDPVNVRALFSQGIVRARGKQDLAGAAASWRRVVEVAPGSLEARQAQQGLDAINAAHATAKSSSTGKGAAP
jgi:tetratricopeptide (TPR) repeat protein